MATRTFNNPGDWRRWKVPNGVHVINVDLKGAGSNGTQGGRVAGRLRVRPGQTLWVAVGQGGKPPAGKVGGGASFPNGGGGGDATLAGSAGWGGGGASAIRAHRRTGPIRAVAGGAGGTSGDGGSGGRGGIRIGEDGSPGNAGAGATTAATGGSISQAGFGGNSSLGAAFDGMNGRQGRMDRGGRGGEALEKHSSVGGGGGGGGFYPGGGGQAGQTGQAPAGGGAGGSNYTDPLFGVSINWQGGGGTADGEVTFTWDELGGNDDPFPPDNVEIQGQPATENMSTNRRNKVVLTGFPDDRDGGQGVRIVVVLSTQKDFRGRRMVFKGSYGRQETKDRVVMKRLTPNTHYYARIYTQDRARRWSPFYRTADFWTARDPNPPNLILPTEGAQYSPLSDITFQWQHSDPDNSPQDGFVIRVRPAARPDRPAPEWDNDLHRIKVSTPLEEWTEPKERFKARTLYEWQARTWDPQHRFGNWSESRTFYITGESEPPEPIWPKANAAYSFADAVEFRWQFRGPQDDVSQVLADIRYRVIGAPDWITVFGDATTPGSDRVWTMPPETFTPGYRYEWQIRTHSNYGYISDWSESAFFWSTAAPGTGAGIEILDSGEPQRPLGVGHNRAYIYNRGGETLIGEISDPVSIQWGRKRDDISNAVIRLNAWSDSTKALLTRLQTWRHELVIFRDGERVWEGPITRIQSSDGDAEIEAKDPWIYVYRRILRQGYYDAYREVHGTQLGLKTVVERAQQIVLNALAYDDPNVLAYLSPLHFPNDARNSRVIKDFTKSAWQEIDDLAARAGLDYTAVGRRLVLWDTHRAIGRLPEMRDSDFSAAPVVTEYGMSAANFYGVTDGNGIYGVADKVAEEGLGPRGYIEMLSTAFSESEGQDTEGVTLSQKARQQLRETLGEQAQRNIAGRWPVPVRVRLPQNSTVQPHVNIGINQLVPGVWVPIRAKGGFREIAQWQKVDFLDVAQDANGEQVRIVMSPAPNQGEDPDADLTEEPE